MSSLPDLLSLPDEILGEIVSDRVLEKEDLVSLRFTCKRIHALVTEVFAKRYFDRIAVMMTRYSLQALADICKHPLFGPRVRSVEILAYQTRPYIRESIFKQLRSFIDLQKFDRARKGAICLHDYIGLIEAETELGTSGEAENFFRDAFLSLRKYGSPIDLCVSCHDEVYPIGYNKAFTGRWVFDGPIFSLPKMESTLQLLLETATNEGCQLKSLDIHLDTEYAADENFVDISPDSWRRLLSGLTKISLSIAGRTCNDINPMLWSLPAFAENLQELALFSDYTYDSYIYVDSLAVEIFSGVLENVVQHNLRVLTLGGVAFFQQSLVSLFEDCVATMQELSLLDVAMTGSWPSVLSWIHDHLNLQAFGLWSLYEIDEHDLAPGSETEWILWYESEVRWEGTDTIKSGLRGVPEDKQ